MNTDGLSTKMEIINTAVELIKEHGYSSVSINQICSKVGITRSAFYYYFRTKDEIFDSYLLFPETYITENILPFLDGKSCREQFYSIFDILAKRVEEIGPEIVGFVFKRNIEGSVHNIAPRDITLWKTYIGIISKGIETGEIRSDKDPSLLTEAVFHMVNGIGLTWCNKDANFDYSSECKRMIDIVLGW